MPSIRQIAVVGASLAGLRAVEALRREGFNGKLTVVDAETHLPYDRLPLSKGLLARKVVEDDLNLDGTTALEADWLLGREVLGLILGPAGCSSPEIPPSISPESWSLAVRQPADDRPVWTSRCGESTCCGHSTMPRPCGTSCLAASNRL